MTGPEESVPADIDPFDLPDWLGDRDVTWAARDGVRSGALLRGDLTATADASPERSEGPLPCDLLAVDAAYPEPVADEETRRRCHQAWHHGEVRLAARGGRLTLLVPGSSFDAERVLLALARLARAVGADPERYAVHLRVGTSR